MTGVPKYLHANKLATYRSLLGAWHVSWNVGWWRSIMLGLGCACHASWFTLITGVLALVALLVADGKLRREAVASKG